jgi:hypothetical protein
VGNFAPGAVQNAPTCSQYFPGEVSIQNPELKVINSRYHFAFYNLTLAITALYHISVKFSKEI